MSQLAGKLLPWTWAAFVVAAITGFGMFATRAPAYVENPAFQIKFLLLPLACINMAVFHFWTYRGIAAWDTVQELPLAARVAGGASLAALGRGHHRRPLDRPHHLTRFP